MLDNKLSVRVKQTGLMLSLSKHGATESILRRAISGLAFLAQRQYKAAA
jgi:hypothetical protein